MRCSFFPPRKSLESLLSRLKREARNISYYHAYEPGVKKKVIDMAINSSGIRDTARILNINKDTVMSTIKKRKNIVQVNPNYQPNKAGTMIELVCKEAEIDEQWSFIGNKLNQRWI